MNTKALTAVLKRNFVSYFASPTGYVFICLFVLLSSFYAFWPNDFFNNNLANLDQLNSWFPWIMLIFIPAITMSIWADERRQGTDELLLTIPAADFEIVLGKYLAAVAIYTVSLLFSLGCNYCVLRILGNPDAGLFLATYAGYWLVGLAMLSIGMVASFVTANLTVAFIIGVVLNAPLVLLVYADSLFSGQTAIAVKQWSISEQFRDFGSGIISLSGVAYFGMIVVTMLYLSMVLIGRRHWHAREGMVFHFAVRALALAVLAVALIVLFEHHDLRADATSEQLSSLSPETRTLLDGLEPKRVVQIEAFITPENEIPEGYVQTRLNLLAMLRELEARGHGKVQVRVNATEAFSPEATRAEKQYGITAHHVSVVERGAYNDKEIFMGVAFTCGLQKVLVPFIDRGIPVEYELVRSLATVTQQKRQRIGVLTTDAQLYGGFNMQTMSSTPNWRIIDELQKAYDLVQVDAGQPITEKYDVLLAVQPSSLAPEQMDHFVAAVRGGQPTMIFEDPFPAFAGNVPGTSAPRRAPGNPMMGMGGPPPKGDIGKLWRLLGIDFSGDKIVCQAYNPYPKLTRLPPEFVFVDLGEGAKEPFSAEDPITSGLQHMLFPFPGSIGKLNVSNLQFTPLVRTGDDTSTVAYGEMMEMSPFGPGGLNPDRRRTPELRPFVLAARISGQAPADAAPEPDKKGAAAGKKPAPATIHAVVVADIDMLHEEFFRLREQGDIPEAGVHFDFDNVTFVLNALDSLAGDNRFIDIRKRRRVHRTLTEIDRVTESVRRSTNDSIDKLQKELDAAMAEEDKKLQKEAADLQKQLEQENVNATDVVQRAALMKREGEQRRDAKFEQLKQKMKADSAKIETDRNQQVHACQNRYKMWAVLLPPIPPLAVAIVVFFTRRRREREGVSRSRLRS